MVKYHYSFKLPEPNTAAHAPPPPCSAQSLSLNTLLSPLNFILWLLTNPYCLSGVLLFVLPQMKGRFTDECVIRKTFHILFKLPFIIVLESWMEINTRKRDGNTYISDLLLFVLPQINGPKALYFSICYP